MGHRPKLGSYGKNLIIWAKALFFFEQLFPVVARTWLRSKSDSFFLGPKFWFLAKKSNFCHTTPILVDDPFLALGMTVNFPLWKPFFDSPFRSYSCFRKKIWLTRQNVFPPPTVGVPSASKSPSALSAQALRARPSRAGLIKECSQRPSSRKSKEVEREHVLQYNLFSSTSFKAAVRTLIAT